ncbi:MAG: hypothetical protein ACFB0B_10925 [Thermonemataceae bacterium]|mgnify:CR=1 FL=1
MFNYRVILYITLLLFFTQCRRAYQDENTTTRGADTTSKIETPQVPRPYFEVTIKGGTLDGKTFRANPPAEVTEQFTVSEVMPPAITFTDFSLEGTPLKADLTLLLEGDIEEGENVLRKDRKGRVGKLLLYQTTTNTTYDFEQLAIHFEEGVTQINKVGKWQEGVGITERFFTGEGTISKTTVERKPTEKNTSTGTPVTLRLRYYAKAVRY